MLLVVALVALTWYSRRATDGPLMPGEKHKVLITGDSTYIALINRTSRSDDVFYLDLCKDNGQTPAPLPVQENYSLLSWGTPRGLMHPPREWVSLSVGHPDTTSVGNPALPVPADRRAGLGRITATVVGRDNETRPLILVQIGRSTILLCSSPPADTTSLFSALPSQGIDILFIGSDPDSHMPRLRRGVVPRMTIYSTAACSLEANVISNVYPVHPDGYLLHLLFPPSGPPILEKLLVRTVQLDR